MENLTPDGDSRPVIAGAWEMDGESAHLIGTKCSQCGQAFFPPRKICSHCLTDSGIEAAKLGNKGKLYAYTVIHVARKDFNPPYAFGFVVLEPENIRIPTLLTGFPVEVPLASGTDMEMVIEKLRTDTDGKDLMTYKFQPVKAD